MAHTVGVQIILDAPRNIFAVWQTVDAALTVAPAFGTAGGLRLFGSAPAAVRSVWHVRLTFFTNHPYHRQMP